MVFKGIKKFDFIDRFLFGCYFFNNYLFIKRLAGINLKKEGKIERIQKTRFVKRKGITYVEKPIPSLDPVPLPHH